MERKPVIGLEVHVQLATRTKLFCSCPVTFGSPPNTQTCPYCSGQPGTLPVLNRQALALASKLAAALACDISPEIRFDRKHYFYPDLPKGYQITQYAEPLGHEGYIEISAAPSRHSPTPSNHKESHRREERAADQGHGSLTRGEAGDLFPTRRIGIERVHLEEDAGKTIHRPERFQSLVDLNRAGVPLVEIVTKPAIHTPEQAGAFLDELRRLVCYLPVSRGEMEKGSLRCDVNVSLRAADSPAPGTRVEIKNLNTISGVVRAIRHEIDRQGSLLSAGLEVLSETRSWRAETGVTEVMRSKEIESDYRYLPEPDIPPVAMPSRFIDEARDALPERPLTREKRFVLELGLSLSTARVLTAEKAIADFFESCVAQGMSPGRAANWIQADVLELLAVRRASITELGIEPVRLAALDRMVSDATVSRQAARRILPVMIDERRPPEETAHELDLVQLVDPGKLSRLVASVIANEPKMVGQVQAGKKAALNALIGRVMRQSRGRADPRQVRRLLHDQLGQ